MRTVSKVFVSVVTLWALTVLGLMGCDRHLAPDNIVSPRADVQITSLGLATGTNGAILSPLSSTTNNTTGTGPAPSSADFPQVPVTISDFNGIAVQLLDYKVDYFQEDGVTPLGVSSFGGILDQRIDPGTLTQTNQLSITPGTPGLPLIAGAAAKLTVTIKVVSDQLRSFLAGPNGSFATTTEAAAASDDFKGLVVGNITVRGVDQNSNQIAATARIAISAVVPVLKAPGGTTQ